MWQRRTRCFQFNKKIWPFLLSLHDLLDCPVARYDPGTDHQLLLCTVSISQAIAEWINTNSSFNQETLFDLNSLNTSVHYYLQMRHFQWKTFQERKEENQGRGVWVSYSPVFQLLQVCRLHLVDLDCPTETNNDYFNRRNVCNYS